MIASFVTPAKAGVPLPARRSGIPAFAGMAMLVLFLLLALVSPALAQTFPKLTGRVVDQANLLSPAQELDIIAKSEALEKQSGAQLVVVTVNSLERRRIEDYSYQLGRHWGIGQEKKDDGVLLLVAPNERKVWISTGYGARVRLTDAVASIIYRESIIPRFREDDYAGGITAGVDQIAKVMTLPPAEAERHANQAGQQEAKRAESGGGFMPFAFWLIVIIFVILSMARRATGRRYRRQRGRDGGIDPWVVLWGLNELSQASRRGRGGWGGGGGFGGFGGGGGGGFGGFSGGGGSFGGGGAGGSW